jgi:hypothetical protein
MGDFIIEHNNLPRIRRNLPAVLEARMEEAAKSLRGAVQKSAEEVDKPSTDTGAMREGMVIQTASGDDAEQAKALAKDAFVGNRSRFDPMGRLHTAQRFEALCGDVEALPSPGNRFEIITALTVLMIYGRWWEQGDAWDFATKSKRPASPWFTPSVMGWQVSEWSHFFEGVIEEARR